MPENPLIETLVVKIASRCNLACTYCYEYFAGDNSWKEKPKRISLELAEKIGSRCREYAQSTGITEMQVVAHGGEPLLLEPAYLDEVFARMSRAAGSLKLKFGLQTNGTLIRQSTCAVLRKHRVHVGVSMDGDRLHNKLRLDHRGQESWSRVIEGINSLKRWAPECYGGILCVVNTENNPEDVLQALLDLRPPTLDLLQPFLTHEQAGARRQEKAQEFGQWMVRAMRVWLATPENQNVRVRVFEDALRAAARLPTRTDWFGQRKVNYLVIETDGSYDILDQLKVIGIESKKYRQLSSSIVDEPIQTVADRVDSMISRNGGAGLPPFCQKCRHANACGASHLTSRYSKENGFANPSTYCEGLSLILDTAGDVLQKHMEQYVVRY